jgi:hypothetical protein
VKYCIIKYFVVSVDDFVSDRAQKRAGKVQTDKYFYDKPNKEWKGGWWGRGVGGGEE